MRRRATSIIRLWVVGVAGLTGVLSGGCVDGFRGSNVQIDLSPKAPAQASPGATPRANQLPSAAHYRLYGIQSADDRECLFELTQFEVHPLVDVASPCFIDVGEHVPYPGLHVSQFGAQVAAETGIPDYRNPPAGASEQAKIDAATAAQRMNNVAALGGDSGLKAITSVSTGGYPVVATSCSGPADQVPPPTCVDAASNARRLAVCQATWAKDPDLWEGTDRVLTSPLAGVTRGLVDGTNPVNFGPVGGAQFFVDEALSSMDAYAIYWQADGQDAAPGTLLLFGRPTRPTRGVSLVHMTSVQDPDFTAELAIFADLGDDQVHF